MKRALITGCNGFIGLHLTAACQAKGVEVVGIDRELPRETTIALGQALGAKAHTTLVLDLTDRLAARDALRSIRPDYVFHLAGSTRRDQSAATWVDQAHDTLNTALTIATCVLELPGDQRPALVFPGSMTEYGQAPGPYQESALGMPASPYGAVKLAVTDIVTAMARAGSIRAVVTRLPIVFGPGQAPTMFFSELIQKALAGSEIPMTHGNQRRSLLYVVDCARWLLALAESLFNGRQLPFLVNTPTYPPRELVLMAREFADAAGARDLLRPGAIPLRIEEALDGYPSTALADDLALLQLTPMSAAIADTVAWYKQYGALLRQ